MKLALGVATGMLGVFTLACHEGEVRGTDGALQDPLVGAWARSGDAPDKLYFHGSGALDDGDLRVFQEVTAKRWRREEPTGPRITIVDVSDDPAARLDVNALVDGETLTLAWEGGVTELVRVPYNVETP